MKILRLQVMMMMNETERMREREKEGLVCSRRSSRPSSCGCYSFLWLLLLQPPGRHLQFFIFSRRFQKAEWIFRSFAPSLPRLQPKFNARLQNTTKE